MADKLPWVGSYGKAPKARDQFAPPPGSYAPPEAREATNTTEDIPPSRSPGPEGHSNQVGGNSTRRGAKTDTLSWTHPSLRKPDLMR